MEFPGRWKFHQSKNEGKEKEEKRWPEDGEEEGKEKRKEKEEEGRKLRSIGDPRLPSPREVEEHNLAHVPYRNWCPHCVRGRGKDLDHRRALDEDRNVSEFSFDYC